MSIGTWIRSRMKISVIMDISVLRFYGYIKNISADILTQNIDGLKLIKIYKNVNIYDIIYHF